MGAAQHPQLPEEDWGQSNFQWGGELGPTHAPHPQAFISIPYSTFCVYLFTVRPRSLSFPAIAAMPPLRGPRRALDMRSATLATFPCVYTPRGDMCRPCAAAPMTVPPGEGTATFRPQQASHACADRRGAC
jgi:hypothetical protein